MPISVSQFMDDLSAEEDMLSNTDNAYVSSISLHMIKLFFLKSMAQFFC